MALVWETVKTELQEKGFMKGSAPFVFRAKVPGGWLVSTLYPGGSGGAFFYPDPDRLWDGSSLP